MEHQRSRISKYSSLILYVVLGASWTLLLKKGQNARATYYDAAVLAVSVEFLKVSASLTYYFLLSDRNVAFTEKKARLTDAARRIGYLFALPEACYCVFNLLLYYNVALVPPATYRIVINTKVLWSGLLMQLFLSKKLSMQQWLGLFLLMLGVGLDYLGQFSLEGAGLVGLVLLSFQALSSSAGGILFQWLLQDVSVSQNDDLWIKNIILYSWGVLLFFIYLLIQKLFTSTSVGLLPSLYLAFYDNLDTLSICVLLLQCGTGLSTSLVLRHFTVIDKEYANFVELLLVACGSAVLLGTHLKPSLVLSIVLVSFSLYLYNVPSAINDILLLCCSSDNAPPTILEQIEKGGERRQRRQTEELQKLVSPTSPAEEIELQAVVVENEENKLNHVVNRS